jgi:hypothetical protein
MSRYGLRVASKIVSQLCVIGFTLTAALFAQAQQPSASSIVLPGKLVAGETATLAVLDAEGRLVPGTEVEFSGGARMTTDATGRLTFPVPHVPGVLRASLVGKAANASAVVLAQARDNTESLQILNVQRLIPLGERFTIYGAGFRGEADRNHVMLGGRPAIVLAASPVALLCLAEPKVEPGPAELTVEVAGRKAGPAPTTLFSLDISADKPQLKAGEQGHLLVRVRGTAEPVEIEVRSLSPSVVRFLGGGIERQTTEGGDQNTATFEMVGIEGGDFSVEARLVRGVQGMPDVSTARQELQAALRLAPAGWAPRVEKLIDELDKHPQDHVKVRDTLEKMMAQLPEGEFGLRLEAAWKILLNR